MRQVRKTVRLDSKRAVSRTLSISVLVPIILVSILILGTNVLGTVGRVGFATPDRTADQVSNLSEELIQPDIIGVPGDIVGNVADPEIIDNVGELVQPKVGPVDLVGEVVGPEIIDNVGELVQPEIIGEQGGEIYQPSLGALTVRVTDAPIDDFESFFVNFTLVEVLRTGNQTLDANQTEASGWMTVLEGSRVIDLLALSANETSPQLTEVLGNATLEAGKYNQVRITVESAMGVLAGTNTTVPITVNGGVFRIVRPFEILANSTTYITIDFTLGEGVIKTGQGEYRTVPPRMIGPVIVTYNEAENDSDESVALALARGEEGEANGGGEERAENHGIPDHAVEILEDVFDLGSVTVDGEILQGMLVVHRVDGFGRNPNAPANQGGGNGNAGSKCYSYIAKGASWKSAEGYVLDTSNTDGMTDEFVANAIAAGLEAWDAEVAFDIFGSRDTTSTVDGMDTVMPDGKNEIFFADIDSEGAIAVASVWFTTRGPPSQRHIVEYDIVFDDVDFDFGDAEISGEAVMDLQNISTHEAGHALGLSHAGDSCTEETMYRYASFGEAKKRSLHDGDIAGLNSLYP